MTIAFPTDSLDTRAQLAVQRPACATPGCKGRPAYTDADGLRVCGVCFRADRGLRAPDGLPGWQPETPTPSAPPEPAMPRPSKHPALFVDGVPNVNPDAPAKRCRIVGCDNPVSGRGLCAAAFNLWLRQKSPDGVALGTTRPKRTSTLAQVTGTPPVAEAPVSQREEPAPVEDREPDREKGEGYDVDARCVACEKWECGAGESAEPSPWKVCKECRRCGECGHEDDCEGAKPDPRDARIAEVERELAAARALLGNISEAMDGGAAPVEDLPRLAAYAGQVWAAATERAHEALTRAERAEAELRAAHETLDLARVGRDETLAVRVHRLTARAETAIAEQGAARANHCEAEAKLGDERTRRRTLRDALARALGYEDGAGDTEDQSLVSELVARLRGDGTDDASQLAELRADLADIDRYVRVTGLDAPTLRTAYGESLFTALRRLFEDHALVRRTSEGFHRCLSEAHDALDEADVSKGGQVADRVRKLALREVSAIDGDGTRERAVYRALLEVVEALYLALPTEHGERAHRAAMRGLRVLGGLEGGPA